METVKTCKENKKKVLVVGSGGREHALAYKLSQSSKIEKLYCCPGNAGIAEIAECVDISAMDIRGVIQFAKQNQIDFVVVAPDDPLAAGMVNELEEAGIPAFGPRKEAAIIEASKSFSKDLMKKYHIPTAKYQVFDEAADAIEYIQREGAPIVVKADGLALGKGVVVAQTEPEAIQAVHAMMEEGLFGAAGGRVVIEECMQGPEVTVLAFTDGKTVVPMPATQDHKRALDGDQGLNTGGMGAVSNPICYTPEIADRCMKEIFLPTIQAMSQEGRAFKGVLYFGLMITPEGPKVVEYNARFGDPECQVLMMLLDTDLFEIMMAIHEERLADINVEFKKENAGIVILASGGYPGKYEKGKQITGLEQIPENGGLKVFHAGTRMDQGKIITAGGRVLGVAATADSLKEAIGKAYQEIDKIHFDGMHYRTDIGKKNF